MRASVLAVLLPLCALLAAAQMPGPPPPATPALEQELVLAFQHDQRALLATTHREHVVTRKDGAGDGRTLRVFYVNGRAVSETIALDERALTPQELSAEHTRFCQRAAAATARIPPPPGELEFAGRAYPFARLAHDYVYINPRSIRWNGRATWVYDAIPNPAVRSRSREETLLLHSRGEVFVDAADRHVVRMALHNTRPVRYGLGVLATIRQADFLLQLQRVAPGVWLPAAADFHLQATILLFDHITRSKQQNFYDFSAVPAAGLGCGDR